MNELLLLLEIALVFSLVLLAKKLFGKTGLILWIGLACVIANIEVTKSIDLFGISATLGNVMFASVFFATDILVECYNKEEAKNGVYVGIFSVFVYVICMQLSLFFKPNEIDMAQKAMENLFGLVPRVSIASVLMFCISNMLDVYLYDHLREKFQGKKMWVRNNISTIVCNCLENFCFVILAFGGIYPLKEIFMIATSTSVVEIIIAICDTPFLYLAKKIKESK